MTPTNTAMTPEIKNIADNNGDKHTVVPTPHNHSQNEVNGLATALAAKANASDVQTALAGKQNTLTFDTTPTANSTNPVTSGGVKTALAGKQDTLTFDSTPTTGSTNPVTSGGVKTALDGKMNNKTIDQTPTDGNTTHLISSDAVYEALKDMAKWSTVKQVTLGQGGTDVYAQYGIIVGNDHIEDFFVYQQIRLVPVGGSDTICEYGAVKTKVNGPYYITSDIDVYSIASTHHTSTFDLQILQ